MNLRDAATRAAVRDALTRDARRLNVGERCPVDLVAIAERLGLRVDLARHGVGDGALRRDHDGTSIVVPHERGLDDPRVRFTTAHEIGHHLLDSYRVPRPASRREYWLVEELCHFFAGRLLIPDEAVEWVLANDPQDALRLLHLAQVVAERARVSRAAVSHRVGGELRTAAFCEIAYPRAGRPDLAGVVRWVVERFPWLRVGPRRHLDSDHFLAPLLAFQQKVPVGGVVTGRLNGLRTASERRRRGIWLVCVDPALGTDHPERGGQLRLA